MTSTCTGTWSIPETSHCAFLILQNDWYNELWKIGQKVWVTLKHFDCAHSTSHGYIVSTYINQNDQPVLTISDGFEVKYLSRNSIKITNTTFGISTQFSSPEKEFVKIHQKSIMAMHISHEGGLGVSASTDGTFHVWDTSTGDIRRSLHGHFSDVNCCKFFPSGMVILSGGLDTQLKIWSVEDGSCARTLCGLHQASILCVDIVERGRNILSCSRDGSIRLWDCGSGTCIATVATGRSEINGCTISTLQENVFGETEQKSTGENLVNTVLPETGTDGKLLSIACENGNLEGFYLANKQLVFSLKFSAALNCCTVLKDRILIAGSQDGSIIFVDVLDAGSFLLKIKYCESPILSTHSLQNATFWLSCGNGRCSLFRFVTLLFDDSSRKRTESTRDYLQLLIELSGSDCDPVYKVIESTDGFVYTCSRDAIVRKYKPNIITTKN